MKSVDFSIILPTYGGANNLAVTGILVSSALKADDGKRETVHCDVDDQIV